MANSIDEKEPVANCEQSKIDITKCDNHELAGNIERGTLINVLFLKMQSSQLRTILAHQCFKSSTELFLHSLSTAYQFRYSIR